MSPGNGAGAVGLFLDGDAEGIWILLFLMCLPTNPNSEYSDTFFDSLDEE